jgi:hypothetical protein
MKNKQLTKSETRVINIISFIMGEYHEENILQDMEICTELILIARILHQRFRKSFGEKAKEFTNVELAKKEILKEIEDDEYYSRIKEFIKDYKDYREKIVRKNLN